MIIVGLFALVLLFAVWRAPSLPARRDRRRTWKGWCQHQRRRRLRLVNSGVPADELMELSQIVEHAGARDPFDLESLLDRYVELTLARHRCLRALHETDVVHLAARAEAVASRAPRLGRVLQRRLALAHDLAARSITLEDNLRALTELIRYYAERATVAADAPRCSELIADTIDRLDAEDDVELVLANQT